MRKKANIPFFSWLLAGAVLTGWTGGCREKYVPAINYPSTGYLVVNGFIDAGGAASSFQLSRTTTLDSAYQVPASGANLRIELEDGQTFPLNETGAGIYTGFAFPAGQTGRSRLHIQLAEGNEYYSDYSPIQATPPVDSVSWREKNNGVQLYVSAHDPQNNTHYYRWRFSETWKYTAKFFSSLVWDPPSMFSFRFRTGPEELYTCWKSDSSTDILLGSTLRLASDVLNSQPVTFIPYSEPFSKLFYKYSINVSLEAMTADEYAWYDKLRRNTESLGSIFDAQPSELTGNVHSVSNPAETVIGWVGSHSVKQSRIFISRQQLPSRPPLDDGYSNCIPDTLLFGKDDAVIKNDFEAGNYFLAVNFYTAKGSPRTAGVIVSSVDCADCRSKGGVLMKPDFWQD